MSEQPMRNLKRVWFALCVWQWRNLHPLFCRNIFQCDPRAHITLRVAYEVAKVVYGD